MSKKNLLMLSASVMFGAATRRAKCRARAVRPSSGSAAQLAGPPPGFGAGGPPPGLGAGGPPLGGAPAAPPAGDIAGACAPHFSRLDGAAGPHGLDRGGPANFRGVEARPAASSANGYARNSYASYGYGRGYPELLAACGGCGLCLWRILRLLRRGCYYVSTYGDTAPGAFWSVMETD